MTLLLGALRWDLERWCSSMYTGGNAPLSFGIRDNTLEAYETASYNFRYRGRQVIPGLSGNSIIDLNSQYGIIKIKAHHNHIGNSATINHNMVLYFRDADTTSSRFFTTANENFHIVSKTDSNTIVKNPSTNVINTLNFTGRADVRRFFDIDIINMPTYQCIYLHCTGIKGSNLFYSTAIANRASTRRLKSIVFGYPSSTTGFVLNMWGINLNGRPPRYSGFSKTIVNPTLQNSGYNVGGDSRQPGYTLFIKDRQVPLTPNKNYAELYWNSQMNIQLNSVQHSFILGALLNPKIVPRGRTTITNSMEILKFKQFINPIFTRNSGNRFGRTITNDTGNNKHIIHLNLKTMKYATNKYLGYGTITKVNQHTNIASFSKRFVIEFLLNNGITLSSQHSIDNLGYNTQPAVLAEHNHVHLYEA